MSRVLPSNTQAVLGRSRPGPLASPLRRCGALCASSNHVTSYTITRVFSVTNVISEIDTFSALHVSVYMRTSRALVPRGVCPLRPPTNRPTDRPTVSMSAFLWPPIPFGTGAHGWCMVRMDATNVIVRRRHASAIGGVCTRLSRHYNSLSRCRPYPYTDTEYIYWADMVWESCTANKPISIVCLDEWSMNTRKSNEVRINAVHPAAIGFSRRCNRVSPACVCIIRCRLFDNFGVARWTVRHQVMITSRVSRQWRSHVMKWTYAYACNEFDQLSHIIKIL